MYLYNMYGLKVSSQIKIDEINELNSISNNEVDIYITLKDEKIDVNETNIITIDKNNIIVDVKDVARYTVTNGKSIVVELCENTEEIEIKNYLLGWSFGCIFVQRKMVPLHASSVLLNNKALVIAGHTQAGKSTLSNRLMNKGYNFISDDICVIDMDENKTPMVIPSIPVNKIRPDMVEKLGYKLKDKNSRLHIDINDSIVDRKKEFGTFVYLMQGDVDEVSIEEIRGKDKIDCFLDNVYSIDIEVYFGLEQGYFKKCLDIVKKIKMYKMTRPIGKFTVDDQIKILEKVCQ